MAGYVLYNGFWNASSVPSSVQMLVESGKQNSFTLSPLPNTAVYALWDKEGGHVPSLHPGDVVICFDKDVRLLHAMEAYGLHVYNSAQAVAACDDKAVTHRVLASAGIPMPRTLVAPMTYVQYSEAGEAFLQAAEQTLSYPMVGKECFGSLGEQVYLIRTPQELRQRAALCAAKPFLLQQYIASSCGRDLRLYVVGGRVVAAMQRRNLSDFRANLALGGKGHAFTPTPEQEALATRCCALLGLDFGGVDLLFDEQDRPLVCEVNASAQLKGITACTGVDIAAEIVRHIQIRESRSMQADIAMPQNKAHIKK